MTMFLEYITLRELSHIPIMALLCSGIMVNDSSGNVSVRFMFSINSFCYVCLGGCVGLCHLLRRVECCFLLLVGIVNLCGRGCVFHGRRI